MTKRIIGLALVSLLVTNLLGQNQLIKFSHSPVYSDDNSNKGKIILSFLNQSENDILLKGEIEKSKKVEALPVTFKSKVKAQGKAKATIKLSSAGGDSYADFDKLEVSSEIYSLDTSSQTFQIIPAKVYDTDKLDEALNFDAKNHDWLNQDVKFYHSSDKEGEENTFSFATAYDDDNVYLVVEVIDPSLCIQENYNSLFTDSVIDIFTDEFKSDAIEIRFDARQDPKRAQNTGNEIFNSHLLIALQPGNDDKFHSILFKDQLPEKFKYSFKKNSKGYILECAIPSSYMEKQQGKKWNAYRINIILHNLYPDGKYVKTPWQPEWKCPKNIIGSGTFFK